MFNPFPHIDAFWRLCSRRLSENIVTKEEIAQIAQFLLLPQCLPLLVIVYPFYYRDFLFFEKICSKSSAAELSYNPFPHTDAFWASAADDFWKYCVKGEIAHNEQFHRLTQCFQLYFMIKLSFIGLTYYRLNICFQSHLLLICCRWERVKGKGY